MQTYTISARDIQQNYKAVVDRVKHTKQPAILVNQKEPQAVIVSLEDFEKLQGMRKRNSARSALNFAKEVRSLLKDEKLPSDLSAQHDYYLWEEQT
jgi:prevent-host-death family protein